MAYANKRQFVAQLATNGSSQVVGGFEQIEKALEERNALGVLPPTADTSDPRAFQSSDFTSVGMLSHLTPALMDAFFDRVLPALQSFRDTHIDPADPTSPTFGAMLRGLQPGRM